MEWPYVIPYHEEREDFEEAMWEWVLWSHENDRILLKAGHITSEVKMDKEYEEWMWEQILEEGPPQDDDITWIKLQSACAGALEVGTSIIADTLPDESEMHKAVSGKDSALKIRAQLAKL